MSISRPAARYAAAAAVTLPLAALGVSAHIAESDGGQGLVCPGEEEYEVAGVMAVGTCVGLLAPEELVEPGN